MKKIGIVMTIKDRVELTKQSLADLLDSCFPNGNKYLLVFVDDGGERHFNLEPREDFVTVIRHQESIGIKKSLLEGIDVCWKSGCDIVTNLDNDVRLKTHWLMSLLDLQEAYPDCIVSGFHSTNKNLDGSERHKIISQGTDYCFKESVGGINMMFNRTVYEKYIKPALATHEGNWDHIACQLIYNDGGCAVVTIPSVIQHTGIHESSMGHNNELPDVAADWYDLELPNVMLFGFDDRDNNGLSRAFEISQRSIKFGDALMLKYPVDGKKGYSEFMIHHLYHYVHTSHVLVIQADGYIINPQAWNNDWLQYDYIGATWGYKDNMNVGNGGFSLRSSRLCNIINELVLNDTHPEDFIICRQQRKVLEEKFGIKFAPEEIANQFSIEAHGVHSFEGANKYNGQFGFHGRHVDFSGWKGHRPYERQEIKQQVKRRKISDIWEGMQ